MTFGEHVYVDFRFEKARYAFCNEEAVRMIDLDSPHLHFKIPSEISLYDKKRYKVIGVHCHTGPSERLPSIISFDEASEIEEIPIGLIQSCKSTFYLSPRIKRVSCPKLIHLPAPRELRIIPRIVQSTDNRFVSVSGKNFLVNNHPLELVCHPTKKARIYIRETAKIVGCNIMSVYQNIVSLIFPSSVEIIGANSFNSCHHLRFITFKPNSRLKIIQDLAFYDTAIEHINFPPSVKEIGRRSFYKCEKLESISFPKGSKLSEIGGCAFLDCVQLNKVDFAEDSKLKFIGASAFQFTAIKTIFLSASIEEICKYAFKGCKQLKSVSFQEESILMTINEKVFCSTALVSIKIPPSVRTIDNKAFHQCSQLKSVEFQEESSLYKIGSGAFSQTAIETIEIPPSVVEIHENCFSECYGLRSVTFRAESKLKMMEDKSFKQSGLESIVIPSSVGYIGNEAFADCKSLESVKFLDRSNVKFIGEKVFAGCPCVKKI